MADRICDQRERLRTAMGFIGVARDSTIDYDVYLTLREAYSRFAEIDRELDEIMGESAKRDELNTSDRQAPEVSHG